MITPSHIIALCLVQTPSDQRISNELGAVAIRVAPTEATVADRITIVLEVTTAPSVTVDWPDIEDDLTPHFVLYADAEDARPASRDQVTVTRTLVFEPFLPGERTLPILDVTLTGTDPTALPTTLTTAPVNITINPLITDEADLQPPPPKDVLPLLQDPTSLTPWFIIAGSVAVVALAGTFLLVRRRGTAQDSVLSDADQLLHAREHLDVAVSDTDIPPAALLDQTAAFLRLHAQVELGTHTADLTTEELAATLADSNIGDDERATILQLLERIDETRFTPGAPEVTAVRDIARSALALPRHQQEGAPA